MGEKIALTTNPNLPTTITVTSKKWTVGGTKIAGYNPTSAGPTDVTPIKAADLKQDNMTFYWVYPNSAGPIAIPVIEKRRSTPQAATPRAGTCRMDVYLHSSGLQLGAHPQSYARCSAAAVCVNCTATPFSTTFNAAIFITIPPRSHRKAS